MSQTATTSRVGLWGLAMLAGLVALGALPTVVLAGECWPGQPRACEGASGGAGMQRCQEGTPTPYCQIQDNNEALVCNPEEQDCGGIANQACNCQGCLCGVNGLCCFGEGTGGVEAYLPNEGGTCSAEPSGKWGDCEVEHEEVCGQNGDGEYGEAGGVGNPIRLANGEVTYRPPRPDVVIYDEAGPLELQRDYSTGRHKGDAMANPRWGNSKHATPFAAGWDHNFAHQLVIQVESRSYIRQVFPFDVVELVYETGYYREPGRPGMRFIHCRLVVGEGGPPCLFLPDLRYSLFNETDGYTIRDPEGRRILFHHRDGGTGYGRPNPGAMRPVRIEEPDGRVITLDYWQPSPGNDAAACKAANTAYWYELCRISSSGGGYLSFGGYRHVRTNAVNSHVAPIAGEVRYGIRRDGQDHELGYIEYKQGFTPRLDPDLLEGDWVQSDTKLNWVRTYAYDAFGTPALIHSESYKYGRWAYRRPDLPVDPNQNYQQDFVPIVVGDGLTLSLLERAFNASGELISGHYYDRWGRGVATFGPRQFLRVEHGGPPGNPIERRVVVTDESKNQQAEFLYEYGQLTAVADGLGCLKRTATISFADEGKILATRQIAASGPGLGVQSATVRDSRRRPLVSVANWEKLSGLPATAEETSSTISRSTLEAGPSRLTTFAYQNSLRDTPIMESRVYSVLCPDGAELGYDCAGAAAEPMLSRALDLDTGRVTDVAESGLTVDAATGEIAAMERRSSFQFDTEGRLLRALLPGARGYQLDYFASETEFDPCASYTASGGGVANVGKIRSISVLVQTGVDEVGDPIMGVGGLLERRGAYHFHGGAGCHIGPNGVVTIQSYNAQGRLVERRAVAGSEHRVARYSYSGDGKLLSTQTGSILTEIDYAGASSEVRDPAVADPAIDLFCFTQGAHPYNPDQSDFLDAAGVAERQAQCLAGLATIGQPLGARLKAVTSSGATVLVAGTTAARNLLGDPTLITTYDRNEATERQQGFDYDLAGRLAQQHVYRNSTSAYDTVHFTYDNLGRQVLRQDPGFADYNQEITYDALNRVATVTVGRGTPEESMSTYDYDLHDNLTHVVDGDGRETRYLYDDFGQLVAVKSPDTGLTRYRYTESGELAWKEDAEGRVTKWSYDQRGRLTQIEYLASANATSADHVELRFYGVNYGSDTVEPCPGGDRVFNQEHVTGRLSEVVHESGATFYSYTPFGEVAAVFVQEGTAFDVCAMRITRYTYDTAGRRTSVTMPSGRRVLYVFGDGERYPGRVELEEPDGSGGYTSRVLASNIEYTVDGRVKGYGTGSVSFSGAWSLAGEASTRVYSGPGGTLFAWDVRERDLAGNILRARDDASGKMLELAYDGQQRVEAVQGEGLRGYQDCDLGYDLGGNRTSETCYGKAVTYDFEETAASEPTNRLGAVSWEADDLEAPSCGSTVTKVAGFSPDAAGRETVGYTQKFPVSANSYSMNYGPTGRLAAVDTPSGVYRYSYDHRNLRLEKSGPTSGASVWFSYDESGRLIAEDTEGELVREYVYLGSEPLAVLVTGDGEPAATVATLGVDHLGTPMRGWDSSGEVVWAADYEAFGRAWAYLPGKRRAPSVDVRLRFPGQYEDSETGLHYNWFRYYDPGAGRYISAEPVLSTPDSIPLVWDLVDEFGGHPPAYGYAYSDPLRTIDFDGEFPKKLDKLFGLPKKFWRWYHRQYKRKGDPDLEQDEARELYKVWKDGGSKGPDQNKPRKRRRQPDDTEWWEDVLELIIPLPPLFLPPNCGA